jgi:membrane protein
MADASAAHPGRAAHGKRRGRALAFFAILKETVSDWIEVKAMRLSAALALYTILSLAPLLVITLKLVGVVLRNKDYARDQITDQITDLMGWRVAEAIQPMIEHAASPGAGSIAAIVSTCVLIFSATGVFAELQDSMNTIWGVKPRPNSGVRDFIHNRLLSLAMVFGIGFLLLVSMFITAALDTAATYVAGDAKWLGVLLDVVVSFAVESVLFAAIFKFLPDVKLRWRHVWLGAALTGGLFTLGKYGLALYFKYASPTSAFGAAGSLAAVLLWVYYSAFILFFGAEFTKVWSIHHLRSRVKPAPNAVKVTESERAKQGIPSEQRMCDALEGRLEEPSASPSPAPAPVAPRRCVSRARRGGNSAYALAAGGVVVGAIAGGLGASYWLRRRGGARR